MKGNKILMGRVEMNLLTSGCGVLHEERYRDENEHITYVRQQAAIAGESGDAAVRSNEK